MSDDKHLEALKGFAEIDFLSCPDCGSKNITVTDEGAGCMNCGYEEEEA